MAPTMTDADSSAPVRAFTAFRARVRALPGGEVGWRIGVAVVGVAIIVTGIVLLPLPGPGWLVIFAGLGVLATEFEWASRLLGFARTQVRSWTAWVARQSRWLQAVIGLAGLVVVASVALLMWRLLR